MTSELRGQLSDCDTITQTTVGVLNRLSVGLSKEWGSVSDMIKDKFRIALLLISLTFITGASLSIVFGFLIAQNIVKPIRAITSRFKAFSARELEFAREIEVTSKDEIGELAEQYNRFLNAFRTVTSFKRVIEEDENVEDIYLRLGTIMTEELGFHKCDIYEISTYNNTIKPVYPLGADAAELHCDSDILLNSDLCRVKRTGHSVSSMECDGICKYFRGEKENVHFCIPIIIAGKVGGIVQIIADTKDAASPDLMRRLSKANEYISEAQPVLGTKTIMRAFREFSIKDTLTDLYNRRFLEETADNLVSGILRRETRLALLMCDLDFFKEVNDKYGHDVGDVVLKETAACIKRCVRISDLVIRFGGEEFLVLLMDIEPDYSMEIAEKIRITVEQNKIHATAGFIQKTISIGISEFPMDTQGFWEAIKFADVALYRAKETGRNKAVRFTSDMWTEKRF
jgi:diguanylate cyclase (GGDEF)-like protein